MCGRFACNVCVCANSLDQTGGLLCCLDRPVAPEYVRCPTFVILDLKMQ